MNVILRHLLAAPFVFAALYHLLTLFFPNFGEPSSNERHLVFILINSLMTFFHYWRPKLFFSLASILIFQQLYSHGKYGLEIYNTQARIDWYSLIVVFGFPIYLMIYWKTLISKKS